MTFLFQNKDGNVTKLEKNKMLWQYFVFLINTGLCPTYSTINVTKLLEGREEGMKVTPTPLPSPRKEPLDCMDKGLFLLPDTDSQTFSPI